MGDYSDTDQCALRSLKRDLPAVAYPEMDSLLYHILKKLGWKEEHRLDAPGTRFVKMVNPLRSQKMRLPRDKYFWMDKESVIAYAKRLGKGQTVYKDPDRDNYNICFTVDEYRLDLSHVFIIHRT